MSNRESITGVNLSIQDLSKSFGKHRVLEGLNLEVKAGEFVAIVGRSGCGKSTLLRLVSGLEPANEGNIFLDGVALDGLNSTSRVMFQDARLLPWKRAIQNVALGLPKHLRHKAAWALAQVGLAYRAQDYPAILSGGQRQRIALARALVTEPRLLLLDEPLGALDALTRIEMQRLIESLWLEQKFTALLITHDVEEAVVFSDRIVLIESGSIVMNEVVDLPRPRARGSAIFASLVEHIRSRVMNENEIYSIAQTVNSGVA